MKIVTLDGGRQTVNDALVIRGSYMKDGLYTTSRCENWWSFDDQTFTIIRLYGRSLAGLGKTKRPS